MRISILAQSQASVPPVPAWIVKKQSFLSNCPSSKVLSFNPIKDIDKIRFNHYITRKKNKNRLTGELENGKFKMTIRTVMEDLNFSKGKSERMINEFEKMGIIKSVLKEIVQVDILYMNILQSQNVGQMMGQVLRMVVGIIIVKIKL